jgi:hypothetical protein
MHPSFDWFCQHRRRRPSTIWDPIIIVPWISLKVMSFPTAVSFLFFDNDDCLYFIRQGEGVTSSTTILSSKIVKTIRHLRSIVKGLCSSNSTSPFGRPRERWYLSSLTWTFQLPLLGRSIKTSSTIILINVSSTMMISSIVDGFGSYYSLSPFGGHARESLVCSSPFFYWLLLLRVRVLASCQSSYE